MQRASVLKSLRAYFLYGGIAAFGTALSWPKEAALDWRFVCAIVLAILTAWKALGTKPSQEPPAPEEDDKKKATDPV